MSNPAPTRRGPAPRFSREEVFAKALEVIDASPPGAFSMRRLADSLGITAMTLYGYADSKDAIVEGATVLALSAVRQETGRDATWEDEIRAALREIHLVCSQHPNLAELVVGRAAPSPGLFRNRERILDSLLRAGFDEATALHALGVLSYYALGFGGGQAARGTLVSDDVLAALPPDEFPRLTHVRGRYGEHLSEDAFEFGLDLLLDGLRRRLGS